MGYFRNISTSCFGSTLRLLAFFIFVSLWMMPTATAGDWRSKFNTPDGVDCCGIKDCNAMPESYWVKKGDRVKVFPGYPATEITIVHPSQDGKIWVCTTGCAFMPGLG